VPIVSVTNVEQVDATTEENSVENSENSAYNDVESASEIDENAAEHEEDLGEHYPGHSDPEARQVMVDSPSRSSASPEADPASPASRHVVARAGHTLDRDQMHAATPSPPRVGAERCPLSPRWWIFCECSG
jgi:hypothetical protein